MPGSTIPAAVAALVTLFKTAAPAGVTVFDGPVYDPPDNFLTVGWDRVDVAGVAASQTVGDYGRARDRESFDVTCLLSYSYDAGEVTTVRGRMFAAFDLFDAALDADPTLAGAVMQSMISAYEFTPILTEAGSIADLRFTVHVEAFK